MTLEMTSRNPATDEVIWNGKISTQADIDKAFTRAQEISRQWAFTPHEERVVYLKNFKDVIFGKQALLAEAISIETGKPLWESTNEVASIIAKIDISIDAYSFRCHDFQHPFSNSIAFTRHRPHGIVAVLGPYNFPGHLSNGHIVPAILAGNAVIFKPSELTPFVGELIAQAWKESELPEGVINLVQGGADVGKDLASHPLLNGLFFTGSWNTGKTLLEQFSTQPEKILALEMGGNNPLVFFNVNDVKAAAYHTVQSAYLTAGQRCTCARRLIVVEGSKSEDFLDTLSEMIKGITVGPYTNIPQPFMGPLISKEAAQKLLKQQDLFIEQGAIPLFKMQSLDPRTGFLTPGLLDVTSVKNRPDEEFFGPLLQLIRVKSLDEAIKESNRTQYGLSAGILTDSQDAYHRFFTEVKAGIINWNMQLTGASSSSPFGGVGRSGNFRPSALYAADYCSFPVASMENEKISIPSVTTPGLIMDHVA